MLLTQIAICSGKIFIVLNFIFNIITFFLATMIKIMIIIRTLNINRDLTMEIWVFHGSIYIH